MIKRVFLLFLLLAISHSALAMRCNSRLALEGDSSYKFLQVCGEPDYIERSVVYNSVALKTPLESSFHRNQQIVQKREEALQVEKWTYNFGPRRFIREVTFVNGVAQSIEIKGRGF